MRAMADTITKFFLREIRRQRSHWIGVYDGKYLERGRHG